MERLEELWPDRDRREAALERILLRINGIATRNGHYSRPLPPARTEPTRREEYLAIAEAVEPRTT